MNSAVVMCMRTQQTWLAGSGAGFKLQEYPGGYKYCPQYASVAPTIESDLRACKGKCGDCWGLTYYEGLETAFAKKCYVFASEAECGTMLNYKDTGDTWVEENGFEVDIPPVDFSVEVLALPSIQNSSLVVMSAGKRYMWPLEQNRFNEGSKIMIEITAQDEDGFVVSDRSRFRFIIASRHSRSTGSLNDTHVEIQYDQNLQKWQGSLTESAVLGSYTAWLHEIKGVDGTVFQCTAEDVINCGLPVQGSSNGGSSCRPLLVEV